ncbi:hypothetical protein PInf_004851 [Phytophthora infestans]|nr:hypothetical protein PInf_004851 [Phytophthora infestans]
MRLSYILVVVSAAALITGGIALPRNTGKTSGVSTVKSPNEVHTLALKHHAGEEKRFLRGRKVVDDEDDDDDISDIDDDDEEERKGGANLFSSSKLDQMMNGVKEFKRYKNLKAYGYSPSTLQSKLERLYGDRYRDLWQRYRANYYTI